MIVHVMRSAELARIGRVAVATDTAEIADVVRAHGGEAVMTRADHPSGSDRSYEALCQIDPAGQAQFVVNLQGDFPTIRPDNIRSVMAPLANPEVDIATLAAEIHTEEEITNPNVVKVIGSTVGPGLMRALYFTRATAPWGDGPRYHHIGLYAYRRAALERFVGLPPSPLEKREKLEQLRALEAGMRIDVAIVETLPAASIRCPISKPPARYWLNDKPLLQGAMTTNMNKTMKIAFQGEPAPIPISPSPMPIRTPNRCPAPPSRTHWPRSLRARPNWA